MFTGRGVRSCPAGRRQSSANGQPSPTVRRGFGPWSKPGSPGASQWRDEDEMAGAGPGAVVGR